MRCWLDVCAFQGKYFTGLNNLKVLSIADVQFDEYFGFTDEEVREMLEYYELSDHYEMRLGVEDDGYQFGKASLLSMG